MTDLQGRHWFLNIEKFFVDIWKVFFFLKIYD